VVQSFFDLEGKDVLYNKKVSMNIFGVDDEIIQPTGQIWGDVKLEEGFEVIDNKIMYNSAMDDKPRLSTAISVSRKVNKTDPNKQVLYFEISRKTDPENDHKLVEGGWHLWPDWPEWLMYLRPYVGEPAAPVYIPQSAAYGCLHHNLEDIVFQISFDEDIDIMYNKIKDYEIGQRNFINHDLYDRWPDGDQLTDDKESFIPQYFEYTDAFLYPETEEGMHYNFYKEVPSVNNWDKQMAVLNLYLSFVPYINWLTTFDTILDLWSNEHGIEFIANQKPYEEILDINERDLIIRDFLHKRPNDIYESIVSEIPIILNNKPTVVYFTIFFNVGGKGKSGKTAAYSKKITIKNEIPPGEQLGNAITNTIGMEFVLIPAGKFEMGSPPDEEGRDSDEGPVHHVNIEKAFYMGRYEVTQKQWRAVMGDNPSHFKGDDLPVEQVSWDDVQEFIKKLNEKEGIDTYRLPSEAEWEYACRAGTTTRYSFGDSESRLGDYAWYNSNSGSQTHPVGQKKANPWGLYDLHGNVWEWVQDSWHSNYDGAPADGSAWESEDGANRVLRCGCCGNYAWGCRSAIRGRFAPRTRGSILGFRLLKSL
jgi:formylglycine-generating enzyme required for sulfatase activity